MIFSAYFFSQSYEVMSGYMRGFGISLMPAVLTIIGICGVRIVWIYYIFPKYKTFLNIMAVYPISLGITDVIILIAFICAHPAKRVLDARKK